MHIPDGYLGPQTYLASYVIMAPAWVLAARRVKGFLTGAQAPLLGLAAAFSFVVMMFNIPLGVTTGHATGAALIAILLGPSAALITVSVALAIQALVFGDGGILTFGANCLNMALVMPFVASGVFTLLAGKAPASSRRRYLAAAVAGYIGLNAAALLTAVMFGLQPGLAHDTAGRALYAPYPLSVALPAIMLPHLLVFGLAEAAVTGLGLRFLENIPLAWKPSFQAKGQETAQPGKRLYLRWLKVLAVMILLSPLGILLPAWLGAGGAWGEWSTKEIAKFIGYMPQGMTALAEKWKAPLPDYNFPPVVSNAEPWKGEAAGKLALAYIVCAVLGVALILGISWLLNRVSTGWHLRRKVK